MTFDFAEALAAMRKGEKVKRLEKTFALSLGKTHAGRTVLLRHKNGRAESTASIHESDILAIDWVIAK
jgi:hypothetical protein